MYYSPRAVLKAPIGWASLLILSTLLFAGCSRSHGTIKNQRANSFSSFKEPKETAILITSGPSVMRMDLRDGSRQELLDLSDYVSAHNSSDGRTWTLFDWDENFYLWRAGSKAPQIIQEVSGRSASSNISPNGAYVFISPQGKRTSADTWQSDDYFHLIDAKTGSVQIIDIMPEKRLSWSSDSRFIMVSTGWHDDDPTLIDAATGEPTRLKEGEKKPTVATTHAEREALRNEKRTCGAGLTLSRPHPGGSITLTYPDKNETQLVTIKGVRDGAFNSSEWQTSFFFTPSCQNVVFSHGPGVMLVNVESQEVYVLSEKGWAYSLEDASLEDATAD